MSTHNVNLHSASITHISWGKMEVSIGDKKYNFKDCKAWPEGAKEWGWNLTGTRHRPGIQPADIEEILDQDIEVLILSRGMDLVLQTAKETKELLRNRKIKYQIEETRKAVSMYNDLAAKG